MLFLNQRLRPTLWRQAETMAKLLIWLQRYEVTAIYAYNAAFNRSHLPELGGLHWHDIIRLVAYRQHNSKIPHRRLLRHRPAERKLRRPTPCSAYSPETVPAANPQRTV